MLKEAFLGLGSNLGNSAANIREGVKLLERRSRSVEVSGLYRTTPQGFSDQPYFVNAACRIWTDLDPFHLLEAVLQIEQEVGRLRTFTNAPRSLDIDVLMYGGHVLQGPPLTLPHPRMHVRSFVLRPLMDIAPDLVHPIQRLPVSLMWRELPDTGEIISRVL